MLNMTRVIWVVEIYDFSMRAWGTKHAAQTRAKARRMRDLARYSPALRMRIVKYFPEK
jgi:hypothetical protein